jgi:TPR repeat protein
LQGEDGGQYALGICYQRGVGTETNAFAAFNWLKKSAGGGYDKAQAELGGMYLNGIGVKQNSDQAFVWFQKAAMQGNPNAEMSLGFYYALENTNKDLIESCKWISLANSRDPQAANIALNTLKERGIVFSPEQIEAGKQRAEEFMKTNQFALPSTNPINGL